MSQRLLTSGISEPATPFMAKPLTRWKASAIHLSICALIALSVLAWMLFVWYPSPYFEAVGGSKLSMTIIGVDVVIGPLITLIIYNPAKKSLRFDLSVVALLQLGALVYGIYVVYEARPVYVVFNVDRFDVVAANELEPAERKKVSRPEYRSLPLNGPRIVAAVLPADPKERERILFSAVGAGYDLPNFPQYYVPYKEQTAQAIARSRPLDALEQKRAEAEPQLAALKKEFAEHANDLGFLPVRARKKDLTAIIDRKTGEVVKILSIDPWV
ncbi:MAG: TfpX/TfpZ family type IV pilin accessory protein [Gammaproteobacteria bacterium]